MNKERILWIDGLKFIAILLVVWGHVLPRLQPTPIELKYTGVAGWIYSFHMPLFMTLSGYVSQRLIHGEGDVLRKFRQLIVPCIILAIICFIIGFNENFWYLKSLFICYVIALYFFRCKNKYKCIILILGCIVLFPAICHIPYLGSYKVDFMLPFFFLGLLLAHNKDYLHQNLRQITFLSGILFLLCFFFWSPEYIWYNSSPNWIDYKAAIIHVGPVFNIYSFWTYIFRFITGAVASIFFIALFTIVYTYYSKSGILKKIAHWGGYSLHVYILQAFIARMALDKLNYTLPTDSKEIYSLITFFISLLIVALSIYIAKILERNLYINKYLFGKI